MKDKTLEQAVDLFRTKKEEALTGHTRDRAGRPKEDEKARLSARERIALLCDPGSFSEHHLFAGDSRDLEKGVYGDGVVTGTGRIDGRYVCIYSQDPSVHSGSVGPVHLAKQCAIMDLALKHRLPFVGLQDSAGGRIETSGGRDISFGRFSTFTRHIRGSGVIPQLIAILGPCTGNGVYGPALADFIFMVDRVSQMYITGPRVVKEVTSLEVSSEELGSAAVHCKTSGVADLRESSEEAVLASIRRLLGYLPSNCAECPPMLDTGDDPERSVDSIYDVVPGDGKKPYDMHKVISLIADRGEFFEIKREFAGNIIVGLARLHRRTVGVVANQPMVLGGAVTSDASDKASRFIRFCDCFNIPLLFLVDTPGYMPGIEEEHKGIIRHGAKLPYAITEATVPKITLFLRKCYGGGMAAMAAHPDCGTDRLIAWPTFQGWVMGAEAGARLLYRRELSEAALRSTQESEELWAAKVEELRAKFCHPYHRAAQGMIDEIIDPKDTRRVLTRTIEMLRVEPGVTRKHGNMPV